MLKFTLSRSYGANTGINLIILLFIFGSFIPDFTAQSLKPFWCPGNKYGFINEKGDTVVPCKYDYTRPFSNGLAIVSLHHKYGIIDGTGKEIILLKYDRIEEFSKDLAIVQLNNKYGIIDLTGKEILPLDNDLITRFAGMDFYVFQKDKKYGVLDGNNAKIITAPVYDHVEVLHGLMSVRIGNKYGVVNPKGEEVLKVIYDSVKITAPNTILAGNNGLYGFMDAQGETRLPIKYQGILPNYRWKYNAKMDKNIRLAVKENGKWGFLNSKNEPVIPLKYEQVGNFCEEMARVRLNDKWGYINRSGKNIIAHQFDDAEDFSESLAIVGKNTSSENLKYAFIDKKGNPVTEFKYDYAESFYYGTARVEINGKQGIMDKNGKEIVELKYDAGEIDESFYAMGQDNILITAENEVRLLDKKGAVLVPAGYDIIDYNEMELDPYVVIGKNKKTGWYNILEKKEAIPVIYDGIYYMEVEPEGRWMTLFKDGKYGIWDLKKQIELIPPVYSSIVPLYEYYDYYRSNILQVEMDGKKGCIDLSTGAEIIPVQFDNIWWSEMPEENFVLLEKENKKGLCFFAITKKGIVSYLSIPVKYSSIMQEESNYEDKEKLFVISDQEKKGMWNVSLDKEIIPPVFDDVYSLYPKIDGERYILVLKNEKYGVYDRSGKEIITTGYQGIDLLADGKNGYFVAMKSETEKYGLIGTDGKEVLPFQYDDIISISKGKAKVSENGEMKEIQLNK